MKTLLLSCDEYIFFNEGKYFASSYEKYLFFMRYLRVFDKLKLVDRKSVV